MEIKIKQLFNIAQIIGFILITISLLEIFFNPTTTYEISIYTSTPTLFWISITYNVVVSILYLLINLFKKFSKFPLYSYIQIILSNCLVISLFAIKGYYAYLGRGDTLSYAGLITQISESHFIYKDNFYPLISILISQINQVISIQIIQIVNYIPIFFYLIFVFGIIAWSKELIPNEIYTQICFICSVPLFFPWFYPTIYPMLIATLLLPLVFYSLKKFEYNKNFMIIVILLLLANVFLHPIVMIFLIAFLCLLVILEQFKYIRKKFNYHLKTKTYNILFLSSIMFLMWLIIQYYLLNGLNIIIQTILEFPERQSTSSIALGYTAILGINDTLQYFLLTNSDELLIFLLSFIAIYILFKNPQYISKEYDTLRYLACCLISGNMMLTILFFITRIHGPLRLMNLNLNIIFAIILAGFLIWHYTKKDSKIVVSLFIIIIIFSSVSSIFSLYPSPLTIRPNDQISKYDIFALNWLISLKDPNFKVLSIETSADPFAQYILGDEYYKRIDFNRGSRENPLPNHFVSIQYGVNNSYNSNYYVVISEFDILAYTTVWEKINKFNNNDFNNLNNYFIINKIYDNNDFRVYLK